MDWLPSSRLFAAHLSTLSEDGCPSKTAAWPSPIAYAFLAGAGLAGILVLSIWSILATSGNAWIQIVNRSDLPIFTSSGLFPPSFAVVTSTYLFTRPTIDIDNRMLLPFFVCIVMTLFDAFALWQAGWPSDGKLTTLKTARSKDWRSSLQRMVFSRGWTLVFQIPAWLVAAARLAWYVLKCRIWLPFITTGWISNRLPLGAPQDHPGCQCSSAGSAGHFKTTGSCSCFDGRPIYGVWVSFPKTRQFKLHLMEPFPGDPAQAVFVPREPLLVVFNDFSSQFQDLKCRQSNDQPGNLLDGLKVYGTH